MVIARIEAFIADRGCPEVIRRVDAYVDAGADAVLIHSNAKRPTQIREFCRS